MVHQKPDAWSNLTDGTHFFQGISLEIGQYSIWGYGYSMNGRPDSVDQSLIDALHLPSIQRHEHRFLTLRTQRYANAVLPARIDTHCDALSAIDEDLHYALVNKYAQLEMLLITNKYLSCFWRPGTNIRKDG